MQPIRDIDELAPGAVLHHSAFGFAEVRALSEDEVALTWESDDENLPSSVTLGSLRKAWTMCRPEGFFARALLDRDALSEELNVDPPKVLKALLADLGEPQERTALREWMAGRGLLSAEAFDRWWANALPLFRRDVGLALEGDTASLSETAEASPATLLERTSSPSERLDIALANAEELGEPAFSEALFSAWVDGSRAVRDRALAAAEDLPGSAVLRGLLAQAADPTEALIHAVRNGAWRADEVESDVHESLAAHLLRRLPEDVPLDAQGRLAAALSRWGSAPVDAALARSASTADGRRLVRATLVALPPHRAAELAADLFTRTEGEDAARAWLAEQIFDGLDLEVDEIGALLDARGEAFAEALRMHYAPEVEVEEEGFTAELELASFLTEAVPVAQLPPQTGLAFVAVGLALARGLAAAHGANTVVTPSRESVWLLPDGGVEFRKGGQRHAHRPPGEQPSKAADVFSSAVLLVEAIIGRPWPVALDPSLAIPYLRGAVPGLPPAAIAPLDSALHPDPQCRPQDGLEWLVSWQAAAIAEDERLQTTLDPSARLDVGYDSHVGRMKILYTQTNQDALFVAERSGVTLLVVCDGISTATAGSGDVAAGITAHVVSSLWEQALTRLRDASVPETEDFLARAFRMANQAVCEAALRFAGGRLHGRVPMGTTAVVGISRGNRLTLAWLGDSRAYVVGPYGASLLTADMNQAGDRLVGWTRGDLQHWDANGYALVGYVGHFDEAYNAIPLQPAVVDLYLLPGERLVICSDGVTDYASPSHPETANRIARAVLGRPCDEAARALIELANQGGGGDNATAIVACLRDS